MSGSDDKKVKIWNLKNFEWTNETLNQEYSVKSIAYSFFIAINKKNDFNIYKNYFKYKIIADLARHNNTVTGYSHKCNTLVVLPSNENIVSGSDDESIKVWNSTTLQLIATLTGHTNVVKSLFIVIRRE